MQVTGLHRLEFENGRVVLTLAIGELESMLQKIWLRADAFYLRLSHADAKLAYVAKALARVAGDQATLSYADSASPCFPARLEDAGFICDPMKPWMRKRPCVKRPLRSTLACTAP